MKIKYVTDINSRVTEKKVKSIKVKNDIFDGYITLIDIKKVSEEKYVPRYNNKTQKIIGNNNKWILLYPKDKGYTITAMYDENLNFIEFYIDMVDKVMITQENIPYMYDLYLDVVITYDMEVYILDQDELYEALKSKDITPLQYEKASKTAEYVISKYSKKENFEKLKEFCSEYLKLFD